MAAEDLYGEHLAAVSNSGDEVCSECGAPWPCAAAAKTFIQAVLDASARVSSWRAPR